ncbi:MAG TPA: hypothetical protein VK471_02385 [Solirubrobacterales bacterium]|nr:hypothetical protein [Solirubrobacterales bacterium]
MCLLALAIAIAAIAIGCGGTGDDPATAGDRTYSVEGNTTLTTGTITKRQFISRVNGFCREAWWFVQHNFNQFIHTQDPAMGKRKRFAEAMQLTTVNAIEFHMLDSIRFLGVPADQKQQLEAVFTPMLSAIERGRRMDDIYSLAQLSALFGVFNRRAHQYRLDDCLVNASHMPKIQAYMS